MGLEGRPVSLCPAAAGPGPQKAPIIVDTVPVIAIRPYDQTPAPESEDEDVVGLCGCPTANGAGFRLADGPSSLPGRQPLCV